MSDVTQTVINQRPAYIQGYDEALLQRVFGGETPQLDAEGNPVLDADGNPVLEFSGGLIDDPELFNQLDYVQAEKDDLQSAVTGGLDTAAERQDFMDRATPYFTDAEGTPRYLPEAGEQLEGGAATVASAVEDYFPDAKTYLGQGTGIVGAKDIYDTELGTAKTRADEGTQSYDAQARADTLFGDARSAVKGGLGDFDAKESFDRRTGRATTLSEQGLGAFDPSKSVDSFMNPYQEKVMDAAIAKIDREGRKAQIANADSARRVGAFGGSRSAVQAAETERNIQETKQNTIADMMSKGYQQSLTASAAADEAARGRALKASGLAGQIGISGTAAEQKAYEDAAKRGIAGGQQLGSFATGQLSTEAKTFEGAEGRILKAADMYRSMGLSSAEAQARAGEDEKKRNLETGRLVGGLGSSLAGVGGTQADIGKAYGTMGNVAANIGNTYAGMAPRDMNFMYNLGGTERQYDQQAEDYKRANENLKTTTALAPYSYGQNFLTGAPSASMYGTYTAGPSTAPNPFLQGVGAYATYQGMNQ